MSYEILRRWRAFVRVVRLYKGLRVFPIVLICLYEGIVRFSWEWWFLVLHGLSSGLRVLGRDLGSNGSCVLGLWEYGSWGLGLRVLLAASRDYGSSGLIGAVLYGQVRP